LKKQYIIHLPVIEKQNLVFKTQNFDLAVCRKVGFKRFQQYWFLTFYVPNTILPNAQNTMRLILEKEVTRDSFKIFFCSYFEINF
jgi:hypothetical protein